MDDFEKFYLRAVHFLKFRPRSEKEVRDKLLQNKAPEDVIIRIVERLKQQKFLDDTEFAKWWIRQRTEFRPKSERIIRLELLQKGVSKEVVDALLREDEEVEVDDVAQARKLIESRERRLVHLEPKERKKKLIEFLARRGFDWDTIKENLKDEQE